MRRQAPRRGRPRLADAKQQITIRLEPTTIDRFRATGPGWQTRIAAILARHARRIRRAS